MTAIAKMDHGGGLDRAIEQFGGKRDDWIDLSTGINPKAYPVSELSDSNLTALPDAQLTNGLVQAARRFWRVPIGADVLAAPGASALIALIPLLRNPGRVRIDTPTYNEHAAAFVQAGWQVVPDQAHARVIVHPNNPDGRLWDGTGERPGDRLLVIDESFCDVDPDHSHIDMAATPNTIILKSFGKFWGLAGLRLGFAVGRAETLARLRDLLGPWPVSGPALRIGTTALLDEDWANATRKRLAADARRLDAVAQSTGPTPVGGTDLFRTYACSDAEGLQIQLANRRILCRIFPYSESWIRLGIPGTPDAWLRLQAALAEL